MPVAPGPAAGARRAPHRPPGTPRPTPVEFATGARVAALERAAAQGVPGAEEAFWRDVAAAGSPLVEDGGGGYRTVTFVWRGGPGTRAVLLLPNKVADPADLAANLMRRVPGTDVWHRGLRMRRDWHATYALCVDEGGGPGPGDRAYWGWLRGRGRPDPLNPAPPFPGRWGGAGLSVVRLDGAPADPLAPRGGGPDGGGPEGGAPDGGAPRGRVEEHLVRSAALGNTRRVWVYLPPGHRRAAGPLPLLVLLDGEMWQPRLDAAALLDRLAADGRIPPVAALLPEALDGDTRWAELTCREEFTIFLRDELLPWAAARWPVADDPARTAVAGQSLGGLTAAFAALRAPERFGAVLAQSGSFWWPDAPPGEGARLVGAYERAPRLPVRFHLAAGLQEWALLPAHRRLRDVLAGRGYEVAYREYNGGHDYLCWRGQLADALEWWARGW